MHIGADFVVDLNEIAAAHVNHDPNSNWYRNQSLLDGSTLNSRKKAGGSFSVSFFSFELLFPWIEMGGGISSANLFGLDELIIFSFYKQSTSLYKRVADLGANLGLHSAVLASLGYEVTAYEPDPSHSDIAREMLSANSLEKRVEWIQAAVVSKVPATGNVEFVRVNGNSTSSHVAGAKENPYGELSRFSVPCRSFGEIVESCDLIKMDVEGLEGELVSSLSPEICQNLPDIILEVGTQRNALSIFEQAKRLNLNLFSQKNNWNRVIHFDDMPMSYKHGSLFLTRKSKMPWPEA